MSTKLDEYPKVKSPPETGWAGARVSRRVRDSAAARTTQIRRQDAKWGTFILAPPVRSVRCGPSRTDRRRDSATGSRSRNRRDWALGHSREREGSVRT